MLIVIFPICFNIFKAIKQKHFVITVHIRVNEGYTYQTTVTINQDRERHISRDLPPSWIW